MSRYLLIESRDPFETSDVAYFYDLARGLAAEGNAVTLFLVQNGVLPARPGTRSEPLANLVRAGVRVLADDFSLRERGIRADGLLSGIEAAPLEIVVDQLAAGNRALWH